MPSSEPKGLSDRQLGVRWLELPPKIIVDVRLISVHAEQSEGLERHIARPVVFLEMTVVVAPPHFLGAADEQTETGNNVKARAQSEKGRAGPTEQAGHC
jgi:hypothetical protein